MTGQVLLREPPRVLELLAYVDGTIVETIPQQGVVVEAACSLVQGIFGIGGETWGEIVVAVASPDEALTPASSDTGHEGQDRRRWLLLLGRDDGARRKNSALRAWSSAGFMIRILRALLGYDLGVAITGTEQVGFTLILTEGFGTIPMASKTFRAALCPCRTKGLDLRRHADPGRRHSSGDHHSPARVHRRDVPTRSRSETGIRLGDPVRIIRDPLFGKIGEVSALPSDLPEDSHRE